MYKTLEKPSFLYHNLIRQSQRNFKGKMVHYDTENTENTFIKGFLNINEWFIWFCNLYRIHIESVWNVLGYCGLRERSIRRAICQHHGHKNLRIHTFFLVEIWYIFLVEILIIILHLIYCMIIRKLVEIVS